MTRQQVILALILFILLPTAIGITAASLYTQSIRLDESQSLWVATKSIPMVFQFVAQDVHVPLYLVLLHFWLQILGNSIAIARSLSFIFYLTTLPVLYLLAREAGNRKIAFLTVALFSMSPFIMWYTSEARMYTLFTFVTSLNQLFFLRLFRSRGQTNKFAFFASTVLGLFTHYFFLFVLATQAIFIAGHFLLVFSSTERTVSLRQRLKPIATLPITYFSLVIIALCCFSPWLLYVFSLGAASNTQPLIPPPTSFNIIQTIMSFLFGFQSQAVQAILVSLWPLAVILFFFIFTLKKHINASQIEYFLLATFLPIMLVFAVSFIRPIFLSRYLILVTPTLFFLIAWILINASKKLSSYLIVGFITLSFGLLLYQNVSADTPVKENYQGTSEYLAKSASNQDIIAVTPPFTVYPVEYTYTGTARITTFPEWNRYVEGAIPAYSREKLVEQIKKYQTQYAHMYVVFSYDQGYEDDIKDYLDHNFAMVDKTQFPPGIEVRKYKLRYDIDKDRR